MAYRTFILPLLLTLSTPLFAYNFIADDSCYELVEGDRPRVILSYCRTAETTKDIPAQVEWKGRWYDVTGIAALAFKHCTQLQSIHIPATCIYIDVSAFMYCPQLETIVVSPDNPAYCDMDGVLADKGRTTLLYHPRRHTIGHYVIGSSITTIGPYAFFKSTQLKEITFPETMESIGTAAFLGCFSLTCITLPASLQEVGNYAFYDCPHLLEVTLMGNHPFIVQDFTFSYQTHHQGRLILKNINPSKSEMAQYHSYKIEKIIVGETPPQ